MTKSNQGDRAGPRAPVRGDQDQGVCNIVEHTKKVLKRDDVRMVIGGFHLQPEDPNDELLSRTRNYLARANIGMLYPCHCTNLLSKLEIAKVARVGEAGSGTRIEF